MADLIPQERIESRIYFIRNKKIMLDRDLAELYEVDTRVLNQAVKRNRKRFPEDFMFPLVREEISNISQFVICSTIKHSKNVYVFTEQGVAMLSSVLNSDRAIQVNIQIMRAFTRLREMALSYKELREEVEAMERKYDKQFLEVFKAIKLLLEPPAEPPSEPPEQSEPPKQRIGFHPNP